MQQHTFKSYFSLTEFIAFYRCHKCVWFNPKYFEVIGNEILFVLLNVPQIFFIYFSQHCQKVTDFLNGSCQSEMVENI